MAIELSTIAGILEPLQTMDTIEGQIRELHSVLKMNGKLPLLLIGYSWGAWLGYIFTARFPEMVQKLILISSGPFEEKYAVSIMDVRRRRMNKQELIRFGALAIALSDPLQKNRNSIMAEFGSVISKADAFNPLNPPDQKKIHYDANIFIRIWKEAETLRRSGELLEYGTKIRCPVIAIHGDHDPHPFEGVKEPLSKVLKNFQSVLLRNCGHTPWIERKAKENFYQILKKELKES